MQVSRIQKHGVQIRTRFPFLCCSAQETKVKKPLLGKPTKSGSDMCSVTYQNRTQGVGREKDMLTHGLSLVFSCSASAWLALPSFSYTYVLNAYFFFVSHCKSHHMPPHRTTSNLNQHPLTSPCIQFPMRPHCFSVSAPRRAPAERKLIHHGREEGLWSYQLAVRSVRRLHPPIHPSLCNRQVPTCLILRWVRDCMSRVGSGSHCDRDCDR
jgi:hypothetical protein